MLITCINKKEIKDISIDGLKQTKYMIYRVGIKLLNAI